MGTINIQKTKSIDQVNAQERVSRLFSRSIKKESKMQALYLALSMIDLTTLEGKDSEGKVKQLCYKASHLHYKHPGLPYVAAICVYPPMVPIAKKELAGTGINVASVATAFPSGMADINAKLDEVKSVVDAGADEVDMVISRGRFLNGDYDYVSDEISQVKDACGKAHLKVILETGELVTLDNVQLASDIAMEAGADFIKTSTGKVSPAATPPVVLTMLEAIRDFQIKTGKKIGMKPAGGISTAKQAIQYLVMIKETLGDDWLSPNLFRFGASSLANDILMQIMKQSTGQYQSKDYFSID
ncbi:MAG: deoxyribose-phosphate aldolase [Candidatus Marinimicrobia bacterium]|nr:deoxyribose-phosphate aldolase [Candidatus Neomarinimicrobiota bacterium]MBT4662010.1 deoxyribose-phosphate aldolase [Candidatus Neomarinimicrobiota bacterium]MBT6516641.1 deoxyribose-phosphate aldolase [Candidatus Neomarinimicrobiota bacterium]MBT7372914.1 deoxyribose-phosphate aldolase [Candidatus Neomarinimicrobiota bacterium]